MATPADRGWGTPGRTHGDAASVDYGRRHITKITTTDGSTFQVRKEVAPILLGFLNEIIARGYAIKGKVLDDWGWYVRPIAGTTTLSNHSWGLAVDVNALTNPQGKVLRTDMPDLVPEAAERWGLRWGGTYKNRPDSMHFEWCGSRDDALKFVRDLTALHVAAHKEDDMPMSCVVPWIARRSNGRVPFLEVIAVQGANEAIVVSYNDAPLTPPWDEKVEGDDVLFSFWSRRLKGLTGPPVGIDVAPDRESIVVTCRGGGTYDVAKRK